MENQVEFESFESFKHGLVISKRWLCIELEKLLDNKKSYDVHILAGWTNLLGFMLAVRYHKSINRIYSYDSESTAIELADKINSAFNTSDPIIINQVVDINQIDYITHSDESVYINCSLEHLKSRNWFYNIPVGKLVVLQATDMNDVNHPWYINDYMDSIETITDKYPLQKIYFSGCMNFSYNDLSYNRFMIIGIK